MPRPSFAQIASYDEFAKYYWYRDELIKICKSLNINASGTKIELMEYIRLYFSGVMVKPHKQLPKPKPTATNLTLKTSLIECGFTFGPRFREFFETVTGVKPFKFNVDMVATVKKVKADNDVSFTLGDLLDVLRGKKVYAQYDKSMLQWNRFVKDFCADPATASFPDKIKTASILWAQVRNSTREKVYTTELLTEFGELIK